MSTSQIISKSKPVNTSLVPKGTRQRRYGELRGSSESNELRFIHKARQHQHGAKRSADTGAGGAGRKKESEGGREGG